MQTYHGECDETIFIACGVSAQADGEAQCTDDKCQRNEADGNALDKRHSSVVYASSAGDEICPEVQRLNWGHCGRREPVSFGLVLQSVEK